MATLKDVADMAGVTVTTVSRMLNNKVNVSDPTKQKIYKAMETLDYIPNEVARSLLTKKSNVIGLIVPSAVNFFFAAVIQYIEEYISAHQYKLLLCISDLNKEKESEYFTMLRASRVDGVIVTSRTRDIDKLINFKAPIVTIERTLSDDIPSISSDNYAGGSLAADHLLKAGCRNLVYIGGSPDLDVEANKRLAGFSETLHKNNIKETVVIHTSERDFINLSYSEVIENLFQEYSEADGIFASNDVIAAQILQYCYKERIDVPRQIKVVGYDDAGLSALCSPPLTTIRQPIMEMCKCAVENIIQLIEGGTVPSKVIFPVQLIERGSSL
ncbi:MAG: LacI family transcriptional regulator [Defluviitaleaceae bacterium]|nr:LacI family transcriptional regulator [Defluviitaleaceae bacterium]